MNCGLPLELENFTILAAHEIASDVSHVLVISFLEVESDTWKVFGDVTSAFGALFSTPILQIIRNVGN